MVLRTSCPYSHAVLCVGGSVGFEAMDRPYNMTEDGGGIRQIDIAEMLQRPRLRRVAHLRPHEPPSLARLTDAVNHLQVGEPTAPTFATVGIVIYGILVAFQMPGIRWATQRVSHKLADALADKSRTVTCSEFVTRALEQAGVNLGFDLGNLSGLAADVSPAYDIYKQPSDVAPSPVTDAQRWAQPTPGLAAHALARRAYHGARQMAPTIRRRANDPRGGDQTDFVTPNHLLHSRAFHLLTQFEHQRPPVHRRQLGQR